ncbi:MAG: glycosyltransferase [Acidobacteriales bacterium]|nr:glycosyltransferase [Terriglobales bacterium]
MFKTQEAPVAVQTKSSPIEGKRVLHVLDLSLPLLVGYTIRSRGLINGQRRIGLSPTAISGPMHTLRDPYCSDDQIDGIQYLRTPVEGVLAKAAKARVPGLREAAIMRLLEKRIVRELETGQYDVVHAHSPVLCGIPALRAARKFKLPFVYEIRAFWEDAAVDSAKTSAKSPRYRATRALETYVVKNADAVVGIASSILEDLAARGIPEEKLFLVPNGVDFQQFQPQKPDLELARQLGLNSDPVLGFIGSFYKFEGVDWLVHAAAKLRSQGVRFKLLLAGAGEEAEKVAASIKSLGAEDYIRYLGRIPHEDISRYYSVMDVMVYPRERTRLTTLVTPLKPLEAMAKRIAVLGSDVGGIAELLGYGEGGRLFRAGDVDDFCTEARRLIERPFERVQIAADGYKYAKRTRDWDAIAREYEKVYQFASGAPRASIESDAQHSDAMKEVEG